jgi:hypothetical protein
LNPCVDTEQKLLPKNESSFIQSIIRTVGTIIRDTFYLSFNRSREDVLWDINQSEMFLSWMLSENELIKTHSDYKALKEIKDNFEIKLLKVPIQSLDRNETVYINCCFIKSRPSLGSSFTYILTSFYDNTILNKSKNIDINQEQEWTFEI